MRLKLKPFICIALFIPLLAYSGKVAKEESPESLFELGLNYLKGNDSLDIDMDKEKGIALIRRSAEQGYADAQFNLGLAYYRGEGVSQDYTQAVSWWCKAAEKGYADAQSHLGLCYYKGEGVSQDYTQAVSWYRKAAEQGVAAAQYNLGVCYYKGEGVSQDYVQAVSWWCKAAEQGHSLAIEYLNNVRF